MEKQKYIAAMGEELGVLFQALWQEVASLHRKWDEYVELFGKKESRVVLLNETSPGFFHMLQGILWEDILLHLARLTDSPRSAGRANLTIKQLPSLVTKADVAQALPELIQRARNSSDFCRDWRNRRIAHRDLDLALGTGKADPLAPGSRAKVSEALNAVVQVLNAISQPYMDTTHMFPVGGYGGGAVPLLYVLRDGLKVEARRRENLERGEWSPEDDRPLDI